MISKNLKEHLLNRTKLNGLDFISLVQFLENSEFEFIGTKLAGALGMATYRKAFFNLERLEVEDDQLVYFVMLHEYCHVLKVNKLGKEEMIKQLSTDNFNEFMNHMIGEEILADRFGSLMYFKMNKKQYPKYRTQMLENVDRAEEYVNQVGDLFGMIKDEETYEALLSTFIIHELDWVDINEEQPTWYSNVELKVDGVIRQNWHRLSGDDNEIYYGSLETDEIINEESVTHWRPLNNKEI